MQRGRVARGLVRPARSAASCMPKPTRWTRDSRERPVSGDCRLARDERRAEELELWKRDFRHTRTYTRDRLNDETNVNKYVVLITHNDMVYKRSQNHKGKVETRKKLRRVRCSVPLGTGHLSALHRNHTS